MTLTFRFLNALTAPDAWARVRRRHQARRALADLLAKASDHLIEDIGLTRADVERLQRNPDADR